MLIEIENARQVDGEPRRRWFTCPGFDLIVWFDRADAIIGFQMCYPLGSETKALTWLARRGFTHRTVDNGDKIPFHHSMTPILVPDGAFHPQAVEAILQESTTTIDPTIGDLVRAKITEFSASSQPSSV